MMPGMSHATRCRPEVEAFLHAPSSAWGYVVHDGHSAAVIDPALSLDTASGAVTAPVARDMVAFIKARGLVVEWLLETHAHADHLTAAAWLKQRVGGRTAIGEGIREVQAAFSDLLDFEPDFAADGSQFDRLLDADERLAIGSLEARVVPTPGHTSDSVTYVIGDAAFIGDTLFMPDVGSARCDFPGGDARRLYASVRRLYELPAATRVYVCHDYPPGGRDIRHETSVAEQRQRNLHLHDGTAERDFVALRNARDAGLAVPALLYASLQVNLRAGQLPPPAANGRRYLKIPLSEAQP